MFIRFDVIHERDGQTDGQTLRNSKDRAYASHRAVKTFLKSPIASATGAQYLTWDFPDVINFCVGARTISEKAIRFRHLNYNPDRAQKLISSSVSRHLSTRNISSKSKHAFLSNLANRQADKQTKAGKRIYLLLCRR